MEEESDYLLHLPLEIIMTTFKECTAHDLCRLSLVNKGWLCTIGASPILWEGLIKKTSETTTSLQLQDITCLPSPVLVNFKLIYRSFIKKKVTISDISSTNVISVLNSTKNGNNYIFIAAGLNNTVFYYIQIWKYPEDATENSTAVHLTTILPGNTTCAKISSIDATCHKDVTYEEETGDMLEICVGSFDGSIDIFRLHVCSDKLSLFHIYHIKGNVGPITWTITCNSLFISKSSISKRISDSMERFIHFCSDSSRFVSRNSEYFKKNESELTNSDLTEMMKKLSLQLSQSLRHMRSIAARHVLAQSDFTLESEFLKKLSKKENGEETPSVYEYYDYDIYIWNLRNFQCLRHLRREPRIDNELVKPLHYYRKLLENNKE